MNSKLIEQITETLISEIKTGRIDIDQMLPSERELSIRFKTSRPKSALIINEAGEKGFFFLEKTSNDQRKKFIKPSQSFIKEFNNYLETLKSLSF